MKVQFHTNIDSYKTNCFPENLDAVPRKGDKIFVVDVFCSYFQKRGLPLMLEVVDVIWHEKFVTCELTFTEMSLKIANQNSINLFEL